MLKARGAAALTLLASFVLLGAIRPLCGADHAPMACCKSASPCTTGIGTRPDCCRIDPAPATRDPLATQRLQAPSGWRPESLPVDTGGQATESPAVSAALGPFSELALAHHPPVPLFLLNASILR